jgi:hypothetical protein
MCVCVCVSVCVCVCGTAKWCNWCSGSLQEGVFGNIPDLSASQRWVGLPPASCVCNQSCLSVPDTKVDSLARSALSSWECFLYVPDTKVDSLARSALSSWQCFLYVPDTKLDSLNRSALSLWQCFLYVPDRKLDSLTRSALSSWQHSLCCRHDGGQFGQKCTVFLTTLSAHCRHKSIHIDHKGTVFLINTVCHFHTQRQQSQPQTSCLFNQCHLYVPDTKTSKTATNKLSF